MFFSSCVFVDSFLVKRGVGGFYGGVLVGNLILDPVAALFLAPSENQLPVKDYNPRTNHQLDPKTIDTVPGSPFSTIKNMFFFTKRLCFEVGNLYHPKLGTNILMLVCNFGISWLPRKAPILFFENLFRVYYLNFQGVYLGGGLRYFFRFTPKNEEVIQFDQYF